MDNLETILKSITPFVIFIFGYYTNKAWQNYQKKRDEKNDLEKQTAKAEAERDAINAMIEALRIDADKRYSQTEQICTTLTVGISELKERLDKLHVEELNVRLAVIEERVCFSWDFVRSKILESIKTHPTNPEYDDLIDKLKDYTITLDEIQELKQMLIIESQKHIDKAWAIAISEGLIEAEEKRLLSKQKDQKEVTCDSIRDITS